jgi:2,4'-dihydroxyacetophenone dioxygenase
MSEHTASSEAEEIIRGPDPDSWVTVDKAGGLRVNVLWENKETGASISLIEVPAGAGVPSRHTHASTQFMYCLKGEYEYLQPEPGIVLREGDLYRNPKGNPHGPTRARVDTVLLEIHDGPHYFDKPDFHTDETMARVSSVARQAEGDEG